MTNQEKAQQLYNDWREKHGRNPERVEFAAYCLEEIEKERVDRKSFTQWHKTLLETDRLHGVVFANEEQWNSQTEITIDEFKRLIEK